MFRDTPTRMAGLGRPFALHLFLRRLLGGLGLIDWMIYWKSGGHRLP